MKKINADLRPCPFCGSEYICIISLVERKYVWCGYCEFSGPSGKSAAIAVSLWNRRPHEQDRMAHESCEKDDSGAKNDQRRI